MKESTAMTVGKPKRPPFASERVYSTDPNPPCPVCWMPASECLCIPSEERPEQKQEKLVVRRETSGRKGKTITRVTGLPLGGGALETLAADLKRHCATGGTIKGTDILIQGDRIEQVASFLEKKGFRVVRSGIPKRGTPS